MPNLAGYLNLPFPDVYKRQDLCVEFQTVEGTVKAINHLNYTLHKGEKLGIVGESGSGKSVSSLGIMQLIPNPPGKIVAGEILYKGQDLVKTSEKDMQKIRGNEISMIFQEPMTSLNPIIKCGKPVSYTHLDVYKRQEQDKINAYMTLYTALVTICKAAAPMITFMTEELYRNIVVNVDKNAPESIHFCDFPEVNEE